MYLQFWGQIDFFACFKQTPPPPQIFYQGASSINLSSRLQLHLDEQDSEKHIQINHMLYISLQKYYFDHRHVSLLNSPMTFACCYGW